MIEGRRLVIHGRVQGVGFRDWYVARAAAHGAAGWVRNRRDGTVEAVVAGSGAVIAAMTADAQKGPSFARVDRVESERIDPPPEDGFIRKPTA